MEKDIVNEENPIKGEESVKQEETNKEILLQNDTAKIKENTEEEKSAEKIIEGDKFSDEKEEQNFSEKEYSMEEIANTFITGSDEEVYEKLKRGGVTFDESVNIRKEFVKMAKERLFEKDLKELKDNFSDIKVESIYEIPSFRNFALLRGNGLSVKDAFLGANPKYVESRENKGDFSHMTQKKIGKFTNGELPIPQKELNLWRSAFPKDSLQQLTKRYNEAVKG